MAKGGDIDNPNARAGAAALRRDDALSALAAAASLLGRHLWVNININI